jgi:hypothetical protein
LTLALAIFLIGEASPEKCVAPSADIRNLSPKHFSAADRRDYADLVNSPAIKSLRAALDTLRSGHADSATAKTFSGLDRRVLGDRFVVLTAEPGIYGGSFFRIIFAHHLQTVYSTWMYFSDDDRWIARTFERTECTPEQLHWIATRYRELLS